MVCAAPPRLQKLREEEEGTKRQKAHVIFGTAAVAKVIFGLFSLISFASNIEMPKHQTNYDPAFTELTMNRFHEVNELYDGTLNKVHHFMFATDLGSNESFTF